MPTIGRRTCPTPACTACNRLLCRASLPLDARLRLPGVGIIDGVLAFSDAFEATFGLVIVFGVAFPLLVQGLIAFAAAQALGERAENQRTAGRWGRRPPEAADED